MSFIFCITSSSTTEEQIVRSATGLLSAEEEHINEFPFAEMREPTSLAGILQSHGLSGA